MSIQTQAVSQSRPIRVRQPVIEVGASFLYDETFGPDAIVSMTGLTGTVANITDPVDTPDGSWLLGS